MISRILGDFKRGKQTRQRAKNLAAVAKLGFTTQKLRAFGEERRYVLKDSLNKIFDNDGEGYPSSAALLDAAQQLSRKSA